MPTCRIMKVRRTLPVAKVLTRRPTKNPQKESRYGRGSEVANSVGQQHALVAVPQALTKDRSAVSRDDPIDALGFPNPPLARLHASGRAIGIE
jgi:hypothetical protein